jgi:hypothetical protein
LRKILQSQPVAPDAHGEDLWTGAKFVGNGSSTVLLINSGEPRYRATGARSTAKITIATIHQTLLRIASLLPVGMVQATFLD